jgi:hypothetical protein
MDIPRWFAVVAVRELGNSAANLLMERVAGLDEDYLDGQDPGRVAGAILILASRSPEDFLAIVQAVETDWRDVLMGAGLADDDWPQRLEDFVDSSK